MSTTDESKLAIAGGAPAISPPLPLGGHGRELIGEEEEANVLEVMRKRRLHRDEIAYAESFCGRLEIELEKYLDVKHVLLTVSGPFAGGACVRAAGIGPGDEVIVPSISWHHIPAAVVEVGALPVIAQCDETLTIDAKDVEQLITPRTKAIVPTHIHGLPCDMDAMLEIARKHNIQIIEDVCWAPGGSYKGRRLGSLGDSSFFSTNPVKLLTGGTGGFIATNRDDIYLHATSYIGQMFFPRRKAYLKGKSVVLPPTVATMPELTAAVVYAQFKKLEPQLTTLRAIRDAIAAETAGCKLFGPAPSHDRAGECGISFGMYFKDPNLTNRFMGALKEEGVPMSVSLENYHFHAPGEFSWVVDGPPVFQQRAAYANAWPFFVQKRPMHPKNDPWAGREIDYSHIMDRSLAAARHIGMVRLTPLLTIEDGQKIGKAICKVDAGLTA